MRVASKRWGEVTIKKQGDRKNKFDQTKSFSIMESDYKYTIDELKDIFQIVTNLTEKYPFKDLKMILLDIQKRDKWRYEDAN